MVQTVPLGVFQRETGLALFHALGGEANVLQP